MIYSLTLVDWVSISFHIYLSCVSMEVLKILGCVGCVSKFTMLGGGDLFLRTGDVTDLKRLDIGQYTYFY